LTGDSISLPPIGKESVVLAMTGWKLTATNESKAIKEISCIGKGGVNVNVTVTVHDPENEHDHDHE